VSEVASVETWSFAQRVEAHQAQVFSEQPDLELLSALYEQTGGKQLSELLSHINTDVASPDIVVALTRRLLRATVNEQCEIMTTMMKLPFEDDVCLVARHIYDDAPHVLRLSCVKVFEVFGRRSEHYFLSQELAQKGEVKQDLKIAIKRAMARIDQRHPEDAAVAGGLSMSAAAGVGALSVDGEHVGNESKPTLQALLSAHQIQVIEPTSSVTLRDEDQGWMSIAEPNRQVSELVIFSMSMQHHNSWGLVITVLVVLMFVVPWVVYMLGIFLGIVALAGGGAGMLAMLNTRGHYRKTLQQGVFMQVTLTSSEREGRAMVELPDEHGEMMTRHVKVSESVLESVRIEPTREVPVLWDAEPGALVFLEDMPFARLDQQGDLVFRRDSIAGFGIVLIAAIVVFSLILLGLGLFMDVFGISSGILMDHMFRSRGRF